MKNFIQHGSVVTFPVPAGGVVSGNPYLIGALFGVAAYDAAEGAQGELALTGVFDLPKDGSVIGEFAAVYWDDTAKKITTTVSTNKPVGAATKTAGGSAATVNVRLNGVAVV